MRPIIPRSFSAGESELAPRLIRGYSSRIGQVHAAPPGKHGDTHLLGDAWMGQHFLCQTSGLRSKQQHVPRLVLNIRMPHVCVRGKRKDTGIGKCREGLVKIRVLGDIRQIVVVQARALDVLFVEIETQRTRKMQRCASTGAHADRVARIRRDDRAVKHDVDQPGAWWRHLI